MHDMGLKCNKYGKRTRKYDSSKGPTGKKAKNKMNRRFISDRPLQKLVCDVTELKVTNNDEVYLEVIKDLYSNRILEWELSTHPTLKFSTAPLERLVGSLPNTGYQVTLHTDQGWQYQHRAWRHYLRKGHIRQSMSHRATCLDNAACETFFNKLKVEMTQIKNCHNAQQLVQAVNNWINYYNNNRIQNRLENLAPINFEHHCKIRYSFYISKKVTKVQEVIQ